MASAGADVRGNVPGPRVHDLIADVGVEDSAAQIVAEAKRETWERIIAVDLLSYAYLSREALPVLRASGHVQGAAITQPALYGTQR